VATVNIADDTFIVAAPSVVAATVADEASWRRWWPDLELAVTRDRGEQGLEWSVRGPLSGSMEIWLEPVADGVVLHYLLRADEGGHSRPDRWRHQRTRDWKRQVHLLKDQLEGGREAGRARHSTVKEPGRSAE